MFRSLPGNTQFDLLPRHCTTIKLGTRGLDSVLVNMELSQGMKLV